MFASLTEAQLRNRLEPEKGIFIAESPKVIGVALDAGYEPVAVMCEQKHVEGDAADIIRRCGDVPVYVGPRELLASITGYTLTRGVLCAMRRKPAPPAESICRNARRVAVIDGVTDTTNIGAIFRSAAALGIDAVLLTRTSCDPLNRRAIRVSMGSVFLVPWTWIESPVDDARRLGFATAALALDDRAVSIDNPTLAAEPKLALILGTEGDGLARNVIENADYTARIPMSHNVDSLNVAAASAVAFWQLRAPSSPAPGGEEGIVLAGGGGHALSLLEAAGDTAPIAGYTALSPSPAMSGPWLGDDSAAQALAADGYRFHMAFIYAGTPEMQKRRRLIRTYEEAGAKFASIIAPSATVSRNSEIGEGSAVMCGAIVNRARLGRHVVVNTGAIVEHDSVVGDNTFIGPGVVTGGAVNIGSDCFIGLGAKIRNNVKIASGVTVGMGGIVTRDLTEPGIYHGNPLRLHKKRENRE